MIYYRGVNSEMFSLISEGKFIHPKSKEFGINFKHDGVVKHDGSATYGKSEWNAVLGHQIDSSKFETSGISMTPDIERAKYYALYCKENSFGYILEFDTSNFDNNEYEFIIVSNVVKSPKVPEDSEVILRRFDNSPISIQLISNIIRVNRE
jgi:hypothetical protein